MKEVKIQFDYLHGPIWKEVFDAKTGEWSTGIACIDNDDLLQRLNTEAQKPYESLFSFESGSNGCRFDSERYARIKSQLLTLAQTIVDRLNEINDGTYTLKIMLEDLQED